MVTDLLSLASIVSFLLLGYLLLFRSAVILPGEKTVSQISLISLLFTTGLDAGLVLLPLTEFSGYDATKLTSPLTLELAYWGFSVWCIYFISCYYFCCWEPKLQLFKIPVIKHLNNILIWTTAAFTVSLAVANMPFYLTYLGLSSVSSFELNTIAFVVIILACGFSINRTLMRLLSYYSMLIFVCLTIITGLYAGISFDTLTMGMTAFSDYITDFPLLILPKDDYHTFYLGWWFAWSIMLGQYLARYVGQFSLVRVMVSVTIAPVIPLLIWFTVLYQVYLNQQPLPPWLAAGFIMVGLLFVVNSVDFMISLYSQSLTTKAVSTWRYVWVNSAVLIFGYLLFKQHILLIEYIGSANVFLALLGFTLLLYQRYGSVVLGKLQQRLGNR